MQFLVQLVTILAYFVIEVASYFDAKNLSKAFLITRHDSYKIQPCEHC